MTEIVQLLQERGKTHGDFAVHARIAQRLESVISAEMNYQSLNEMQRESLHMILHKIGRIVAGNPNFKDHWDDIGGYAKLISDRCGSGS